MVRYIGKRLLQIIPIFFVVSVLIFALVRMSPTEPITVALVSRVTRTSMIKELKSKYVETAEAKGISKKQIIFKHAFKNAIIPVITVMSIQIGAMVVGSVLVENVFALPGLGSLLINAINTSDYPIVQSVMLLLVAVFLILNLIVDIIYAIIDPRIRY